MRPRTAADEKRSGMCWLIAGVLVLAGMFALWWLVESTNKEGTHDAQLLPFVALVPLLIGVYHLVRSRIRRA